MDVPLFVGDPAITFVEMNMLTGVLHVLNGGEIPATRGGIVEVLVATLTNFGLTKGSGCNG